MPPPMEVRPAELQDVDAVLDLAALTRERWSACSAFYAPAHNADLTHGEYLRSLIESGPLPFYVALSRGIVVASALVRPSRGWAALEELHLQTPAVAAAVLPHIGHRPLRTAIPLGDRGLRAALDVSDMPPIATIYVGSVDRSLDGVKTGPHPFGRVEASHPDALVAGEGIVGRLLGGPRLYDRPGATAVVDVVSHASFEAAKTAGAGQVLIAADDEHRECRPVLADAGFEPIAVIHQG